ncbi:MAG: hypothetical protein J1F27_08345, partial [Prevotellaceae bacterium]|nr:hypothetical protein [Prevotellaceae bacterium]
FRPITVIPFTDLFCSFTEESWKSGSFVPLLPWKSGKKVQNFLGKVEISHYFCIGKAEIRCLKGRLTAT